MLFQTLGLRILACMHFHMHACMHACMHWLAVIWRSSMCLDMGLETLSLKFCELKLWELIVSEIIGVPRMSKSHSYICEGIWRQGIGSFVRSSCVSTLCPVVVRPHLCWKSALAAPDRKLQRSYYKNNDNNNDNDIISSSITTITIAITSVSTISIVIVLVVVLLLVLWLLLWLLTGFQTGSGQTGSSQKCRDSP